MGYDCYIRGAREARPDVNWNDEASIATYREWSARNYFRRNMFGGSRLADALEAMGMGFTAETYVSPPEFPDIKAYGCDWGDDGEPVGERAEEYEAAVNAVLDWHGPEIPGIPVHKIAGTNDGWHVTKEEAKAALVLYEFAIRAGKPHPDAFGEDFIPFLHRAAEADGFETH